MNLLARPKPLPSPPGSAGNGASPRSVWQSLLYRCPRTHDDVPAHYRLPENVNGNAPTITLRLRCTSCRGHHHFVLAGDRVVKIL